MSDKPKEDPNRSPRAPRPEPTEYLPDEPRRDQRLTPRRPEPRVILAYANAKKRGR